MSQNPEAPGVVGVSIGTDAGNKVLKPEEGKHQGTKDSEKPDNSLLKKAKDFADHEGSSSSPINVGIHIGGGSSEPSTDNSLWFTDEWSGHTPHHDPEEFDLQVNLLLRRQVLIVDSDAYDGSGGNAAVSLCKAVFKDGNSERRFQGGSSERFSMRTLLDQHFLERLAKSTGFLDFTEDPSLVSLPLTLADELEKRLRLHQCFVVVLVDGQRLPKIGQSSKAGKTLFCGFPVWRVSAAAPAGDPKETTTAADANATAQAQTQESQQPFNDPVLNAIRFVAALFPGVEPNEFASLVDLLLADIPDDALHNGDKEHKKNKERKKDTETRLQRWRKQDRDSLLYEARVSFKVDLPSPRAGNSSVMAGYGFANGDPAAQVADAFFLASPMFSTRCLSTLTRLFLSQDVSETFGVGYLRYVMRLHADRLCALTPAWLTTRFFECLGSQEPGSELGRLLRLFQYILDHANDARIAEEALSEIATRAVTMEDQWLYQLMNARYRERLNEFKSAAPDADVMSLRWTALGDQSDAYHEISGKLALIHEFMFYLVDHASAAVTDAIIVMLTGSDVREEFGSIEGDASLDGPVSIVSAKSMVTALMRRADREPRSLLFSGRAALASHHLDNSDLYLGDTAAPYGSFLGDEANRRQAARLLLFSSHIWGMQRLVGEPWDRPVKRQVLQELLLDETVARECSAIVGEILVEYGRIRAHVASDLRETRPIVDPNEVFDVYLGFARALAQAERQGLTASTSKAISEFMRPLRDKLHPSQRAGIIEFARQCLDSLRAEQDRIMDHASKADMLKLGHRIATMQALIRGFMMTPQSSR